MARSRSTRWSRSSRRTSRPTRARSCGAWSRNRPRLSVTLSSPPGLVRLARRRADREQRDALRARYELALGVRANANQLAGGHLEARSAGIELRAAGEHDVDL